MARRNQPPRGGPGAGALAVLLGALGAALYVASVSFAVGRDLPLSEADAATRRVLFGIAGGLCALGVLLAFLGLRREGRRASSLVGLGLSGGFLAYVAFSFLRAP